MERVDVGAPTQPRERLVIVDVLRGFALFGILLVNTPIFALPVQFPLTLGGADTHLDRLADLATNFLARGRFYSLFSFLFGLGFGLQLIRLQARGISFRRWYVRRLLVLLCIGAVHALLIWFGDILVTYALLGFVLLMFRTMSPRAILTWSAILVIFPLALSTVQRGVEAYRRTDPVVAAAMDRGQEQQDRSDMEEAREAMRTYRTGSWSDLVAQRVRDLAADNDPDTLLKTLPQIFAMFLLGLYAGKIGLFENMPSHLTLIRMIWLISGILGVFELVLSLGWKIPGGLHSPFIIDAAWRGIHQVNRTALCLFYVSSGILLFQRERWRRIISPLVSPGRMALTNYLMQSVVCTMIFYSYGLGLYGDFRMSEGVLLTVVLYAFQIAVSVWWLKLFRFGPLEWFWRSLTYGKWQRMRLRERD